jgi:hemerythrin-like metal-binding protein
MAEDVHSISSVLHLPGRGYQWKVLYRARLDAEHRHLISLLNQLHTALANRREMSILGAILTELVWYTRWHFKTEEALMKRYDYPNLPSHKAEHDDFTEQVAQFVDHFHSGRNTIAIEVSDALQDWLTRHILRCDAAYACFFRSNGIADVVNENCQMPGA